MFSATSSPLDRGPMPETPKMFPNRCIWAVCPGLCLGIPNSIVIRMQIKPRLTGVSLPWWGRSTQAACQSPSCYSVTRLSFPKVESEVIETATEEVRNPSRAFLELHTAPFGLVQGFRSSALCAYIRTNAREIPPSCHASEQYS